MNSLRISFRTQPPKLIGSDSSIHFLGQFGGYFAFHVDSAAANSAEIRSSEKDETANNPIGVSGLRRLSYNEKNSISHDERLLGWFTMNPTADVTFFK